MNTFGSVGSVENQVILEDLIPITSRNKLRSYRFTLNNYTIDEPDQLAQAFLKLGAKKFAFQEEIGLEKKTPHLQGCVFFKSQISFNTMKKINSRVAWQKLSYPKKAIAYCLKEDTRKPNGKQWTYGIIVSQYVRAPEIPYQEMLDNLRDLMLQDVHEDYLKAKDQLEKEDLWNSPNYGYGNNV